MESFGKSFGGMWLTKGGLKSFGQFSYSIELQYIFQQVALSCFLALAFPQVFPCFPFPFPHWQKLQEASMFGRWTRSEFFLPGWLRAWWGSSVASQHCLESLEHCRTSAERSWSEQRTKLQVNQSRAGGSTGRETIKNELESAVFFSLRSSNWCNLAGSTPGNRNVAKRVLWGAVCCPVCQKLVKFECREAQACLLVERSSAGALLALLVSV